MTVRQDIFRALHDAIGWQEGLVDAHGIDSEEGKKCAEQIARYRTILKRWYGTERSRFDELMAQCRVVSLEELQQRQAKQTFKAPEK